MINIVRHFWGLALAIVLIFFLSNSWSTLPPLGKLFSPFTGFLQNASNKYFERDTQFDIQGLYAPVQIKYDENGVPHIFAQNDHDLYLAQGYVVARDRLWQMEFYTLVAAGRLAEVVGASAYDFDRYNRRIGMAHTARQITDTLLARDSLSSLMLTAYAAGVNAYMATLDSRSIPVEYKILNYKPEPWSPYKSILMLMNLRNTLNGGSNDYRLSNVVAKYGLEVTNDLFPLNPSIESPIIPAGTSWDFKPVTVPPVPDVSGPSVGESLVMLDIPAPKPQIGSNNWAVGGSKSATGLPILANDPHLQLTLPSIWYQVQLSTPEVNVYGVTMPGAPAVVVGFNKDIAWGVTNVGSDVMDFYNITFEDETRSKYLHEGTWKDVAMQVDTFVVKGSKTILDTIYYTHHGPVVYHEAAETNFNKNVPVGYAMRWITHETDGSEILALHLLNRAADYEDYRSAIQHFKAPAQNFIFASNQNDIAITSNGKLPLKWTGQGRFVMDGSLAANDWSGFIPFEYNPMVKNPQRGFVSSANQFPADPTYPYYLDWQFAHPSRGIRINERLEAMRGATTDSLRSLLNDNLNVDARRILPVLLGSLQSVDSISNRAEYDVVARWNYQNNADEIGASIYESWVAELHHSIWRDDFPLEEYLMTPSIDRTMLLIENEWESPWFDNKETPDKVETADDIIRGSFMRAITGLRQEHGEMDIDAWAWSNVKSTRIAHLVPAFNSFSRHGIINGGGEHMVNATSTTHGPSWRMVVQLDENWPKAFGLYPGGQSGNPSSRHYDNMIDRWAKGELNPLLFLKDEDDNSSQLNYTITLRPFMH